MSSNTQYYLLQLLTFCLMLIVSFLSRLMLIPESLHEDLVIWNGFISSLEFVLITHFVVRLPYKWLSQKRNKRLFHILLLIALSGLAGAANTYLKLPRFEQTISTENLDLVVKTESGLQTIDKGAQVYAELGSAFIFFLVWSFVYFAVVNARKQKQMQIKLQQQQLENLRAQLNPHFLFNSMNTIRALIYEDQDKAAQTVTQLAELFRYNLCSGDRAEVTLQKELEICQRYLDIEKSRLGERLHVVFEIAPDLAQAVLPSMALFTLVENAVKHGVAPLPSGGTIDLKAVKQDNCWLLSVSNPYSDQSNIDGTKLGLDNLRQRLELMFGSKASLKTIKNKGLYLAQVSMPYEA